jgi:hypothetical protein
MTVTSFSPEAHPESNSVDGAAQQTTNADWDTMRAGVGTGSNDSAASRPVFITSAGDPTWSGFGRLIFLYDTRGLGGDSIDSAVNDYTSTSAYAITNDFDDSLSLVASAPASTTAVVNGDFDSLGTTKFATADVAVSGIARDDETPFRFTLNAAGLAAIDGGGVTKFGIRTLHDLANTEPSGSSADDGTIVYILQAEEAVAGDQFPVLIVTHTAPPFVPRAIMF